MYNTIYIWTPYLPEGYGAFDEEELIEEKDDNK